jgi:hypothetical protein
MNPDRVALVTFAGDTSKVPEFDTIRDLVLPHRIEYCKRHGYQHWYHYGFDYEEDVYYAIQRLIYIHDRFLDGRADVVWVLNLAAVITDMAREIPVTRGVAITRDPNGLNAGSMILHRSDTLLRWLEHVIDESINSTHFFYEQHAIQRAQRSSQWHRLYNVLPHPSINQYAYWEYNWSVNNPQNWKPGDFVIHFPGLPFSRRIELISKTLKGLP